MSNYADAGHRPHAVHTGEQPKNPITYGPDGISVTLTAWGPQENIFPVLYDALQANWGDAPSTTYDNDDMSLPELWPAHTPLNGMQRFTGWTSLTPGQRAYIESAFAGKTLPQILEGIKMHFTIDGVSRAFTHQNVRTRIGAAFMQHGGRDNDWRHRAWTMPETIRRACLENENSPEARTYVDTDLTSPITDWGPIRRLCEHTPCFNGYASQQNHDPDSVGIDPTLRSVIEHYLAHGREIYAALVDAGIPWQDARRLLWMGTQTYIHDIYDYLAMASMLANRLEHIMDWEHNCVAQLMVREVRMKCPPIMSKYLKSHSDKQNKAAFAMLESWPPDMKYDPNFPCECGHAKANHVAAPFSDGTDRGYCEVCTVAPECKEYRPKDPLPRTHRPEQNPFFILHPDSMNGGPVVWIPTNGIYPEYLRPNR